MILQNPFAIYITPVSLTLLSVWIPCIALIFYLFTIKNKSTSTKWIIGALIMGAMTIIHVGWRESLTNPHPTWSVISNSAVLFGIGTLAMLIQHGYHHPAPLPKHRFEARFILCLSLASILILGFAGLWLLPHFYTASLTFLLFYGLLWSTIYIRKLYHYAAKAGVDNWRKIWLFPETPLLRSFRTFTLMTMSPLLIIGMLISQQIFPLNSFLFALMLCGAIALMMFIGMFALINHLVEPTNLLYKLTSMAFVLLFLMASVVTYITYSLLNSHYRPTPTIATGQRYRFTRETETTYHLYSVNNSGSVNSSDSINNTGSVSNTSSVNNIEPAHEGQPAGIPLDWSKNQASQIDLDFSFPFYERTWQKLLVSEDGHISFFGSFISGAPQKSTSEGVPFIAPLLVDLIPTLDSDVYIDKTDDFITITWYKFRIAPSTNRPVLAALDDEALTTVGLTLWATGEIEFSYPQVNLHRTYASDMGLHSWLVGISPGAAAPVKPLLFSPTLDTRIDGSISLLQNFQTEAMIYSHSWLAPFALLYIAAGLFILLGFPLFLRSTLIMPVSRLMQNVERVDGGDLSVETEIQSHDEIGFLTAAFNRMVASIRTSQSELATINITLEERIEERTEELALARDEAQSANQAKSRFLANMSHELRTPLNAILGYAQILQQQIQLGKTAESHGQSMNHSLDETTARRQNSLHESAHGSWSQRPPEHGLRVIQHSSEHLLTLLNDILDLSRIEAGKESVRRSTVALTPFVKQIARMIELQATSKGITLSYSIENELPERIEIDERLVRQVLINLLHNAVKFTELGTIELAVTKGILPTEKDLPELAKQNGGYKSRIALRFMVSDSGKGIAEDDLAKIFAPFEQVDRQEEEDNGVGLGLAISQRLLKLMQSRLQVDSTLSRGSSFWFDLPVITQVESTTFRSGVSATLTGPNSQANELLGHLLGYSGPRRQILIVDDNAQNRVVLEEMLRLLGFEVYQVKNGREGVNMALELQPALILMDLIMPQMDGISAVRLMRAEHKLKKTPIVAVSATVLEADKKNSIDAGFNDFLPKPIQLSHLHRLLEKQIDLEWIYTSARRGITTAGSLTDLPAMEASTHDALSAKNGTIGNGAVENDQTENVSAKLPAAPPPQAELERLHAMIITGDISALRRRITELQQLEIEYTPFIDTLAAHLSIYQMSAAQTLIEKYKK